MVLIKDVVRSSVKVPEFDKHLKKAGGHIGRNVEEMTIKMKTIVRKPLIIFTNPSARAGYDTRSIFKQSLTGLNSAFSFS